MSRQGRKRRGCGWSYTEWSHDDGAGAQRHADWAGSRFGGPFGAFGGPNAAWSGPGFFGGRNFRILSGLRRDPWHGKVAGVCAGIGGYYGIRPKWIRIALIVSLFINLPLTVIGYVIATLLLKPLPEPGFGGQGIGGESGVNAGTSAQASRAEEELPPELRFAALKDKFRELEGRTGGIEGLVTSPEFRLRRDIHKMREGDGESPSA
jgi:phage shock protein C